MYCMWPFRDVYIMIGCITHHHQACLNLPHVCIMHLYGNACFTTCLYYAPIWQCLARICCYLVVWQCCVFATQSSMAATHSSMERVQNKNSSNGTGARLNNELTSDLFLRHNRPQASYVINATAANTRNDPLKKTTNMTPSNVINTPIDNKWDTKPGGSSKVCVILWRNHVGQHWVRIA